MKTISHIHHISAIVGNVHESLAFYQDVLQLRLVKQTVNFDDPSRYHLYFANQSVDDGTLMTFFPWENSPLGQKGSGQLGRIAFRIPHGALSYWKNRLNQYQITSTEVKWLDRSALFFQDKHSLELALVESDLFSSSPDILGFDGLEMIPSDYQASFHFLSQVMGLRIIAEQSTYFHLQTHGQNKHNLILPKQNTEKGILGPGTVHHIAWNLPNLETLKSYRLELEQSHFKVTSVLDRKYFKSIYLREPGKAIFEFATQGPGMTIDEPFEQLGQKLQLPKRLEKQRSEIVEHLIPLKIGE